SMPLFRFEHRSKPVLSPAAFAGRLANNVAVACGLIGAALVAGMAGYHITEKLNWLDSFLNASMLLGGMGPVDTLHTEAGKYFAGFYALFCGLLVMITSGVVLAPILHRILHVVHAECDD
ncbi:MAG: hypothetical protein ABUS48_06255, partial [Pseudomonadota bacterium]